MLARPSFFADIVIPEAHAAISRTMSGIGALGVARLAHADEPRVLGEAAGVEEEGDAVRVAHRAHAAQVLERDRLAATRVVGHGDEDHRHRRAFLLEKARERGDVHVPLEWVAIRGDAAFRDGQVERLRAAGLDVGARGVEVRVRRHDLAGAAEHREQDALGSAPLMRGDHVAVREKLLDRGFEAVERRRPRVRLVGALDAGPLLRPTSRRCPSR